MKDFLVLLVSVVLVTLTFGLSSCNYKVVKPTVPAVAEPDRQKAFNDVSYYRNQAETKVKSAKLRFKDYDKKEEALIAIEKAYSDTAARGNAFIETVQLNLTAKTLTETTLDPYVKQIQDSLSKLDETIEEQTKKKMSIEYIEKATVSKSIVSTLTIGGDVVEGAIVGLAKAGVVIWQAAQTAKREGIDDIKKELEKRRWKDWNDIKTE